MKVKSVGRSRMARSRSLRLVPGQLVRGRVIAQLGGGHFRVGAAGQVFEATSDLPLEPGQLLIARVELGEERIFLRILEDAEGDALARDRIESPEEIRRILVGLGHQPDSPDILEFQERLDRYRRHGSLKGFEPSDAWILAILWTRGIRGGADAFALLSYYLRRAALQVFNVSSLLQPLEVLTFLDIERGCTNNSATETQEVSPEFSLPASNQYTTARKREAAGLLNRKAAVLGRYLHCGSLHDAFCGLLFDQGDRGFGRWVDNPTLPLLLIEVGQSRGRVTARLHRLKSRRISDCEALDRWILLWEENLRAVDLEVEDFEVSETQDPEKLRFLFWRKWNPESVRDLMA